ncbi:MAG: GNAT family N-acetyltransferase [Geminicoccaceae bacterium]
MVVIRAGRPADARALARMISDFNVEEGSPGRLTEAGLIDLCFSAKPSFQTVVADDQGTVVGYALVMGYFDTEPCAWGSYMQDLFVARTRRSEGIGRRLIAAVAKSALDQGHAALFWHVRDHNARGRAFYASIGGIEQTPIPVALAQAAMLALAKDAD